MRGSALRLSPIQCRGPRDGIALKPCFRLNPGFANFALAV
jgi:hypothetical protein